MIFNDLGTIYITYYWNNWTKAKDIQKVIPLEDLKLKEDKIGNLNSQFMFSADNVDPFEFTEMTLMKGNYHTALLFPISFESAYYCLMNIPGLAISSFLIEKYFGMRYLVFLYITNCIISGAIGMLSKI